MDNGRKEIQNEEDKVALDDAVRMGTNLDYKNAKSRTIKTTYSP